MDKEERQHLLNRYEAGETELFDLLEEEYRTIVEQSPDDILSLHAYGYLFECKGRRYLEKAEKIYERGLFKEGKDDGFRIDGQLMSVRNALGRNKASIELYRNRVLEHPDDPSEYLHLSRAYMNADQVEEAKKVIKAVSKICDDESIYSYMAGDVCARLGETEEALEWWEKSVTDHLKMDGLYSRAFMFEEQGRLEEAIAEWTKIKDTVEEHHDPILADWPKKEIEKLKGQLEENPNE